MHFADFYARVLPASGWYALFQNKQNLFFNSIEALCAATEKRIDTQGLYFATATYGPDGRRTQDNVVLLKCYRLDLDAGAEKFAKDPKGVYETHKLAREGLFDFIKKTSLMPTIIVASGEGLHVYYELDEAVPPEEWKPVAARLKAAAKALGLKADPTVTADEARVLRPPGALHKNGNRVTVIKDTGVVHNNAEFAASLMAHAPTLELPLAWTISVARTLSINDEMLSRPESPPASLMKIANHCSAVARMRDEQGNVPEPLWRAVIGVGKYCALDGEESIHAWSAGYDGYSAQETQDKIDRWETPPTTCSHFEPMNDGCGTCKYRGKITTPKQLGYVSVPSPEPEPEASSEMIDLDDAMSELDPTPECPVPGRPELFDESRGFFYRRTETKWVLYAKLWTEKKDATGQKIMVSEVKPVLNRLIWGQSASGSGAHGGVVNHFGMVSKVNTGEQTLLSIPAGSVSDPSGLEKMLMDYGVYPDKDTKIARDAVRKFVLGEMIRMQEEMRFFVQERYGYHYYDGKLICAFGNWSLYPDGKIIHTVSAKALGSLSKDLTIACMPRDLRGEYGAEIWDLINPHADKYLAFVRDHYNHEGYELPRLAMSIALASPLLMFVADQAFTEQGELPPVGFILSLYSRESGLGKTSLQDVVALAYGRVGLRRSGKRSSMTPNASMTLAKTTAIFPFLLDEVTQNEASDAAKLVDDYANGQAKARSERNGSVAQVTINFSMITCVSTNVPQRELISLAQTKSDGLQMRLLELGFDGIEPVGEQEAFRVGMHGLSESAGAYGARLCSKIVARGPKEMRDMGTRALSLAWRALGGKQQFRFFARGLACVILMHEVLGDEAPFDIKELMRTFISAAHSTRTYIAANTKSPRDELAELMSAASPNVLVTDTMTPGQTAILRNQNVRHPVAGREVQSQGVVLLSVKFVQEWCAKQQMSSMQFLQSMEKLSLLVTYGRDTKRVLRLDEGLPTIPTTRGAFYTFRTTSVAAASDGSNVVQMRQPETPGPAEDAA